MSTSLQDAALQPRRNAPRFGVTYTRGGFRVTHHGHKQWEAHCLMSGESCFGESRDKAIARLRRQTGGG